MSAKGSLVAGGCRFAIVDLRLAGGKLVMTGERPGPVPPMREEPVAVFGGDGQGFCQGGAGAGALTFPGCGAAEVAVVTVALEMSRVS